jgi:hypothetical protein
MYRWLATLGFALFVAGQAHASELTWPTICIPAHQGKPEQCTLISPFAGNGGTGGVLYDPRTGYEAPDAVAIPQLALYDALGVLWAAYGDYLRGLNPQNGWDIAHRLTLEQVNALTQIAADLSVRDLGPGTHEEWGAAQRLSLQQAQLVEHCGPQGPTFSPMTRCEAAFQLVNQTEVMTLDAPRRWHGWGLSNAQLEALFEIFNQEAN